MSTMRYMTMTTAVVGVSLLWAAWVRRHEAQRLIARRLHLLVPHGSLTLEGLTERLGGNEEWISEFVVLDSPDGVGRDHVWIRFEPATAAEFAHVLKKLHDMDEGIETGPGYPGTLDLAPTH